MPDSLILAMGEIPREERERERGEFCSVDAPGESGKDRKRRDEGVSSERKSGSRRRRRRRRLRPLFVPPLGVERERVSSRRRAATASQRAAMRKRESRRGSPRRTS